MEVLHIVSAESPNSLSIHQVMLQMWNIDYNRTQDAERIFDTICQLNNNLKVNMSGNISTPGTLFMSTGSAISTSIGIKLSHTQIAGQIYQQFLTIEYDIGHMYGGTWDGGVVL